MNLEKMLSDMVERDASDLHLTVGSPPKIRVNGELINLNENKLIPDSLNEILKNHLNKNRLLSLSECNDIDFSIGIKGVSRFRVNIFKQRGNVAATFRKLPYSVPSLNSLGLPESISNLTLNKKGLILITGGTGSGKSTTMAALIKKISNENNAHIITIEDPIEYLYEHSNSLINQREIGSDTKSFSDSLKSVLRQDPDVVSVGELRDVDSMNAALTIAETGHLVLGTLHTNNAAGTINRLVNAFAPEKQSVIRTTLSLNLLGIISQQLIPNKDKKRSLAIEVLINTPSIKSLIRENNIHQIDNYILSGLKDGMIRMDDSIIKLYHDGLISKEDALNYAVNAMELSNKLNTINI
ncbi:PilT/PilU family type 4a pilus ATPase [Candidatus Marinimicrobia bacterium]|nr:PilT/PilU family type 4a pilus ATPase [Candidatus Neomarinimicrobiota bacterium]